MINSSN